MLHLRLPLGASLLVFALATAPAIGQQHPTIEAGGSKPRGARNSPKPRQPASVAARIPTTVNPAVPWPLNDARAPLTQPKAPDTASSVRAFSGAQINAIPFARPGAALEIVPGLLVEN